MDAVSRLNRSPLKGLWRWLPRQRRQALYAWVGERGLRAAPQPDAAPIAAPVCVAGPLRAPTGIGQAARLALAALAAEGVDARAFDLTEALFQPATEPPPAAGPPGQGAGTLLVYAPPPNAARALKLVPPEIRRGKTLVAGWVCETPLLPPMWRRQARFFDHLTAPTRYSADAIAAAAGRPCRVVGHPVAVEPLPARPEARGGPPVIGAVMDLGPSAARKNPLGAAAALGLVLDGHPTARVRLRVRGGDRYPAVGGALSALSSAHPGRVEIVREDLGRDGILGFIAGLDLLLSMSRAEGFGLPLAEAALLGVAVATPLHGGPAEFLDARSALALPYALAPVQDAGGSYGRIGGTWAEVDPAAAAAEMLGWLRAGAQARARPDTALLSSRSFVSALMAEPAAGGEQTKLVTGPARDY